MRKIVVHESEIEGERREPPRVSKILISEHTVGATKIAMGVNTTEVGSRIPRHSHENEEEAMFIIQGEGKLVIGDGEEEIPVKAGSAIYSPLGVEHTIYNTGDIPLKLVWAYAPPLPAHRK